MRNRQAAHDLYTHINIYQKDEKEKHRKKSQFYINMGRQTIVSLYK